MGFEMDTKEMDRLFVQRFLDEIQNLNEIGGPNNLVEYVYVLEQVKRAVDAQIEIAKSQLCECPACSKMIDPSDAVSIGGDPFGLTMDGGDGEKHQYCHECVAKLAGMVTPDHQKR